MYEDGTFTETDLIVPVLYVLKKEEGLTPSEITNALLRFLVLTGKDAQINPDRNDSYFSQKVRNLLGSHTNNNMHMYVSREHHRYYLTNAGKQLIDNRLTELEELFSGNYSSNDVNKTISHLSDNDSTVVCIEDNSRNISEGKVTQKQVLGRTRSKELREKAIEYYRDENGRLKCIVCGFDFETHYGIHGRDYIEIHHEVPICAYTTEGKTEFLSEAINHVKPLCANCHRMVHRKPQNPLSIEELKKIYHQ